MDFWLVRLLATLAFVFGSAGGLTFGMWLGGPAGNTSILLVLSAIFSVIGLVSMATLFFELEG